MNTSLARALATVVVLAATHAAGQVFVLQDELMWDSRPDCGNGCDYYFHNKYVSPSWSVPGGVPADWTAFVGFGIDYPQGTLHWALRILSKPTDQVTSCRFCMLQADADSSHLILRADDVYDSPDKRLFCTPALSFSDTGLYLYSGPIQSLEGADGFDFTKCNGSDLSPGYGNALALVMQDASGTPFIVRYLGEQATGAPTDGYYPIELHSIAMVVAKDKTVDLAATSEHWPDTSGFATPQYAQIPLYVNVGGARTGDYESDRRWSSNAAFGYVEYGPFSHVASEQVAVEGADNNTVYRTARSAHGMPHNHSHGDLDPWEYSAFAGTDLGYRVRVPNGTYRVTLKFAELWDIWYEVYGGINDADPRNVPGIRRFDVRVNGVQAQQSPLDIEEAAGGKARAHDLQVESVVTDEIIDIRLHHDSCTPILNGLVVECIDCPAAVRPAMRSAPRGAARVIVAGDRLYLGAGQSTGACLAGMDGRTTRLEQLAQNGWYRVPAQLTPGVYALHMDGRQGGQRILLSR